MYCIKGVDSTRLYAVWTGMTTVPCRQSFRRSASKCWHEPAQTLNNATGTACRLVACRTNVRRKQKHQTLKARHEKRAAGFGRNQRSLYLRAPARLAQLKKTATVRPIPSKRHAIPPIADLFTVDTCSRNGHSLSTSRSSKPKRAEHSDRNTAAWNASSPGKPATDDTDAGIGGGGQDSFAARSLQGVWVSGSAPEFVV